MHEPGEGWRGDVAEYVDGDGLQAEGERLQVRRRLEQNDACDRGLHTATWGVRRLVCGLLRACAA